MKVAAFTPLLFVAVAAATTESAPAGTAPGSWLRSFSLMDENDKFGSKGTDRYYTQGLKILVATGEHTYVALTQEINTPEDTSSPNPALTDQPYSGALYFGYGYGLVFDRGGRRDCLLSVELKLGVIGPDSGAETIQNKFHNLIGTPEAEGWGTQVPNELALNVDAEFRRRFVLGGGDRPFSDLIARTVVQLGNLRTDFILGAQYRLGHNLGESWGHGFIRHSNGYEPARDRPVHAGFATWGFLDSQVEVVTRNYSVDGGNFRESRGVDRRPIVLQLAAGGTMRSDTLGLTIFMAWRTKEFETQVDMHAFGGLKGDLRF